MWQNSIYIYIFMFSKNQNKTAQHISRNLVKKLFKAKSLNDKIVAAKAALFSKKIQGCQIDENFLNTHNFCIALEKPKSKKQISIGTDIQACQLPGLARQQCLQKCQKDISYLKQTSQTQVQTENFISSQQPQKVCSFAQIQPPFESKTSVITQDTGVCESFEFNSSCSFADGIQSKSCFLKKKMTVQIQIQNDNLNEQLKTLKSEVQNLKSQISIIDEQKNKWKKKAMKYSSKIKAAQNQQQRFENAYKQLKKSQ